MENKNFMKYFKEGVLKYFKIFMKFLNISKWNISSCIPSCNVFKPRSDRIDYITVCYIAHDFTCKFRNQYQCELSVVKNAYDFNVLAD